MASHSREPPYFGTPVGKNWLPGALCGEGRGWLRGVGVGGQHLGAEPRLPGKVCCGPLVLPDLALLGGPALYADQD